MQVLLLAGYDESLLLVLLEDGLRADVGRRARGCVVGDRHSEDSLCQGVMWFFLNSSSGIVRKFGVAVAGVGVDRTEAALAAAGFGVTTD